MSTQEAVKKYLEPVIEWVNRQLSVAKTNTDEKKRLILFREFVKEQMPNENTHSSAR